MSACVYEAIESDAFRRWNVGRVVWFAESAIRRQRNFVKNQAPEIALTVINPTLVIGKPLDTEFGSSMAIIDQLIKSTKRMLPDLKLGIVDVKDVAKMHVDSIKLPDTYGERILSTSETLSLVQIAKIIKANNPALRIVTRRAPTFLLRFLAFFNKKQRNEIYYFG
jgi:dihydroflavonol-4-reductase